MNLWFVVMGLCFALPSFGLIAGLFVIVRFAWRTQKRLGVGATDTPSRRHVAG